METNDKKKSQPIADAPMENSQPEAVPAKAAAAGPKESVEHWAEKHKMLPEIFPGKALQLPKAALGQRSVRVSMARSGEVAPKHNPRFIHFYAAKLHNNWVQGHEMTEAEFLAAVKKAYGPDAEVICR